jgi:hypothetical protein
MPDVGSGGYTFRPGGQIDWRWTLEDQLTLADDPPEPCGPGETGIWCLLNVLEDMQCKWQAAPVPDYLYAWLPDNALRGGAAPAVVPPQGARVAAGDAHPEFGRSVFAQELGHDFVFNIEHYDGMIGEVGWDVLGRTRGDFPARHVRKRDVWDLMTPSNKGTVRHWVRPGPDEIATWLSVLNSAEAYSAFSPRKCPQGAAPPQPFFPISGGIPPDPNQPAYLHATSELMRAVDLTPGTTGAGEVRTYDALGSLLYSTRFGIGSTGDGTPWVFGTAVPAGPDVHEIRLYVDDVLQDTLTRTAYAPEVHITSPQPGTVLTSTLTVEWDAGDNDGDELSTSVLYSHDGGTSWVPLGAPKSGSRVVSSTADLAAGTSAMVKVMVSDGMNTASDSAGNLQLPPNRAPKVHISSPKEGDQYRWVSNVRLSADASDLEDGYVPDTSVAWYSSIDGLLGNRRVMNARLSPGMHTLTFEATDSGGASTSRSVMVTVTAP